MTLFGLSAVPLILGLVQLGKEVGLPGRFAPLLSLALGIAAGMAMQSTLPHPVWVQGLVIGIAIGLSASGLYSHAVSFSDAPQDATPNLVPIVLPDGVNEVPQKHADGIALAPANAGLTEPPATP
jgi:hypothetical protein